jgi:hypothetical protein
MAFQIKDGQEEKMEMNFADEIHVLKVQIRRLKLIATILLAGVVMLVTSAAVQTVRASTDDSFVREIPAAVIAAHDFTLIGKDGKPYGRLFTRGDEPVLELYGKNGQLLWSAPGSASGVRPIEMDRQK